MNISVLIPCYNEEKTIEKCLTSCLMQTRRVDQIVVADDGSTDKSVEIIEKFGERVTLIKLPIHKGNKSYVQEAALKFITGEVFITIDADCLMDEIFVERVELAFKNPKVSAFSGHVKSLKHNWLTACRQIEYTIAQSVFKSAQSCINALYVIPGCAGAFRTEVFNKYITFDHDTLTEDLDFTYKLHLNDIKIIYDNKAIVYTQDPETLGSYVNQIRRWYTGGWQNLKKHKNILKIPKNAFELSLIFVESMLFSLTLFLLPLINIRLFIHSIIPYALIICIFSVYSAYINKRPKLILYSPLYLIIVFINSGVFLFEFFNLFALKNKNPNWFHPKRRVFA